MVVVTAGVAEAAVRAGERAPDFTLHRGGGGEVTPASLRGRPAVLLFSRYLGCPMCRASMASLRAEHERFAARGATVVVVVQSSPERVDEAAPAFPFVLAADPERAAYQAYGVTPDRLLGTTLRTMTVGGALSALGKVLRHGHGAFEGDELQRPAEFVLDENGVVVHARLFGAVADGFDVETLLRAVDARAARQAAP
ncbi:MAG TPA: peroxiredoxin-like family protein [Myxococcota bacterium]|nr:peroxiredoxin-like family protein [Myxococcota bacterium]